MKKNFAYRLAFLPLLLGLAIANLAGQPYYFKHFQVENGLSNNSVFCSAQDQDGFMWFGTKDGLNRFDGYHFKKFSISDTDKNLSPDLINCLLSSNDTLWVGSQKGLYIFNKKKERLEPFLSSLREINSVVIDNKNQLWLISRLTLYCYNFKSNLLTAFPTNQYFEATSICLSDEGEIWVSTINGFIHHYNAAKGIFKAFNVFSDSKPAASLWIQKVYPAGKGSLFIGTSSQGLKQFNISTGIYLDLLTLNPDKTTIYVRDIKRYSDIEYWLATESGVFIYNTQSKTFINIKKKFLDPYSISDNAIYTLFKDREGAVWAGTFFGGVNYYSKQYSAFQKYFPDNSEKSISGSAVREICEDKFGNVWIGTEDAGLNKLDTKTGAITQYKPDPNTNSIAYSNIHGLLPVENDLWIGTFEHGLDIMDIKTGRIKKHYTAGTGKKDLKSNFIVSLLRTSSGEILVGTSNSLFKYNQKVDGYDPFDVQYNNQFISCLFEDHNKTIWIGTHEAGVYYYNPYTGQSGHFTADSTDKNSLAVNFINSIYEDSQYDLWFTTEGGGLSKLNKGTKQFSNFTTSNGLPSNFTFKVLEDNQKSLWVSTSRGLVEMKNNAQRVKVYTKNNGLLNDQFNYNSGYKDAAGTMYFGSVRGMITFQPENLSYTSVIPSLLITGIQIQDKEVEISKDSSLLKESISYTNEITLPYNRSSFSVDFAALSYISPEMTAYSYKMEGLDIDWTELKRNRKIYYTNLSPGNYRLLLKASANGKWGQKKKQLIIKILPPFWATYWAYLLYSIIGISLIYYLLKSYHIIVEDKKEKEIYEAKIEFFTNVAHEIRTPLTLIKGPVENLLEIVDDVPEIKEDVVTMDRNTNRLIALIAQILDFRQTETKGFSIDFIKLNISILLREEFSSFAFLAKKKKLHYTISTPDADVFAYVDEEAFHKIFSNLLTNATKYAEKQVEVRLLPLDDEAQSLTIEIENDGITIPVEMKEKIFKPFYRLKESAKHQGTGLGLALARSLTELHSGELYLKDNTKGVNIFVLCLPLRPMNYRSKNRKLKRLLIK